MPKNFYVALGVSKGADLNQIKSAYRKIVKKLHPDLARSRASADSFIEIREAYETLMDADKRRLYDASLDQKPISFRFAPELLRRPRRFEQELFPVTSRADAFFEGFIPVFFTSGRSRTPEKDVYLEVTLSPEEGRNGGIFPVTVPVLHRCPRCQGESFHTFCLCPLCQGEAVIWRERSFSLCIPPRSMDEEYIRLTLEDIGLAGVTLHVQLRVEPESPFF